MDEEFDLIYNLKLHLSSIVKCQSKKENSYGQGSNCPVYWHPPPMQQTNPYKNANILFCYVIGVCYSYALM